MYRLMTRITIFLAVASFFFALTVYEIPYSPAAAKFDSDNWIVSDQRLMGYAVGFGIIILLGAHWYSRRFVLEVRKFCSLLIIDFLF